MMMRWASRSGVFLPNSIKFSPSDQLPCFYSGVATPISPSDIIADFSAQCSQRNLAAATVALERIQEHDLRPGLVACSEFIKCCVANGAVEQGRRIHEHIFSRNDQPKTFLVNMILNMYAKFNLLDDARDLFDEMRERNVVSWTTMISAYSVAERNSDTSNMFLMMLRDGVMPNMYTYSSVLRACDCSRYLKQLHCRIITIGVELDVFVRSALIDAHSKFGGLQAAASIFDEAGTSDLVIWNSIISGFAQNSEGEGAVKLFIRMKRSNLWAVPEILSSTTRGCAGLALLEVGRQVHAEAIKVDRDLALNNALIDMYSKCGSSKDAYAVFVRMAARDVISWSTMIMGFAQNGYSRRALDLFDSMVKDSGIRPNRVTILGVLFACSHAGLVEEGRHLFESMKKLYGVDPTVEHYGCMIDLLGRAGKLDEAVKLVHEMKAAVAGEDDAAVVIWRTLLSSCRLHPNPELAEYAAGNLLSSDPHDPGAYVLLSNVYAKTRRWDEAETLRNAMKAGGITKQPGCSWIEVNRLVHTFISGDTSHPEADAVHAELKRTVGRLREIGYVPDTNFVLHDVEEEQMESSLERHSEKLAIVYGLMKLPKGKTVRIRKNLTICGDCHLFASLVAKSEKRAITIRDNVRYHHFVEDGSCSCENYW
ncbi:hypothetical protein M569_13903 [Genlisea aurea]|uniref:DYW domain-containing protein n=1 Tax=Genlisea aurea TaxID=192259 RepID=S8DMN0_9LAMI|nr:hypothetical protein M569_13903 [Genlisea aurea]